jgi:hypothetical protein
MTDPLKASILVSNYQGRHFLPKCLSHLTNQSYPNYEILFVDAGSADGSPEYVEANFPSVKTIRCGCIGIGEAVNIGLKNSSGDVIVFDVNTDEYVEPDWLKELIRHLEHYNFNIIAGYVRMVYNTGLIDEAGVKVDFIGRSKKIGHMHPIDRFQFQSEPVDFVGAPAFHKKILEKIGAVDETYFIYAEDLDFCYRAKLAGIKSIVSPLARSHHHIRGTVGNNQRRLEYYLRRANIRFNCIYSDLPKLLSTLLYLCFFLPAAGLLMAILSSTKRDIYKEKFIGRIRAILWNLQNLAEILHSRHRVNKLKKAKLPVYTNS